MSIAYLDFGKDEKRIKDLLTRPADGAKCQECVMGMPIYIPCGKPAEFIVDNRGERVDMCPMCANHNVKNRGASLVLSNGKVARP